MVVSAAAFLAGCRSKAPAPDATAIALGRLMVPDTYRRAGLPYSLPYRLFVPRVYDARKRYPLVLYLHGAGGRGADNLLHLSDDVAELVSDKVQNIEAFFVLAPQCPEGDEWVNRHDTVPFRNYDQARVEESPASQMVFEVIRNLQAKYAIDAGRLYVVGYSMGGSGTWDFITRHPGVFAAAVPITGVNDPSRAKSMARTAVWAFHGDKDDVSPAANTRVMVRELQQLGADVRYSELKDIGHDSSRFAFQDLEVYRWLLSHHRQ